MARKPDIDERTMRTTDDEEIRRHMIQDGEDPDGEPSGAWQLVLPARQVRERLGLRQADFAGVLRVPLATVRNWEQGRTFPDPAARSLLNIVARAPEAALTALCPERRAEWGTLVERGLPAARSLSDAEQSRKAG